MAKPTPLNDVSTAFEAALAARRARAAINQEELAHLAGVDRTFISRLERGIRQPTISTLLAVADALSVSASELVADVERVLNRTMK
jgi:transcriptional regulator with XRE-family HTH domain